MQFIGTIFLRDINGSKYEDVRKKNQKHSFLRK